ncbi:MAG: hypothetical protein LV473_06570 [Nitrospira sp.]|nr:hypothetical protein [Nitrospira sp.]
MLVMLGGLLLGASNDAPTCNASCTVDVANKQWVCTCRWSTPLGLACAQQSFAVPAGATIANPEKPAEDTASSSEPLELTGGEFEFLEGQLTFKTSQNYELRRPYVIPYRFHDQSGKAIRAGTITVTQINVKE